MSKNRKKKIGVLALTAASLMVFAHSNLLFAQVDYGFGEDPVAASNQQKQEKVRREAKTDEFVDNIHSEIRATKRDLTNVIANARDAEDHRNHAHEQMMTLSEQVDNINTQIVEKEKLIQDIALQITRKENDLIRLYKSIDIREIEVANQERMLLDYLKVLYERESSVADTMNDNETINIAKLLLSDETVGDQLQQIHYFDVLEDQGHEMFNRLESLSVELENAKDQVVQDKDSLAKLERQLEDERNQIEMQKRAKVSLMERTQGEEQVYQQLLDETLKQQAQIQKDIQELEENLNFLRDRMELLGEDFDPEDYRYLFSGETTSVYAFINATKEDSSEFRPSWPVDPIPGITAHFRDPGYAAVFGFAHNAIDIRANQETQIRAPADGVVYKVRDNGFGYSYLMVAHKGGFMTLYGHIPEFFVEEGERVYEGQTIALSGGMPGTKGAGLITTGPHLHFEVLKDGKHVDPMHYLDRDRLAEAEELPEQYSKTKVKRGEKSVEFSF